MRHLAAATALRELNLAYTAVGDAGLASLSGLSALASLNLDSCHASDRCRFWGIPESLRLRAAWTWWVLV